MFKQLASRKKYIIVGLGVLFLTFISTLGFLLLSPSPATPIQEVTVFQYNPEELQAAYVAEDWVSNGKYDWIENNKGIFNITHRSSTPIIELVTKNYEGGLMFFTGFNTDEIKPVGAWLYRPNGYKVYNRTYTCPYEFNYTTNPLHFYCYNYEEFDGQMFRMMYFNQEVGGGNLETATVWWEEIDYWKPLDAKIFEKSNIEFQGNNRWYFKDFEAQANTTYRIKLQFRQTQLDTPDVKYWAGFVPYDDTKSYEENFVHAILNDKGIFVDPWTAGLRSGLTMHQTLNNSQTAGGTNREAVDITVQQNGSGSDTTFNFTGILGESWDFDGNDNIDFSNSESLYTTTAFSSCLWINISTGGAFNFHHKAATAADSGNPDWRLRIGATENLVAYAETTVIFVNSPASSLPDDDNWHYICIVYNGSASANQDQMKIYSNGTAVQNADTGDIPTSIVWNAGNELWSGNGVNGNLDEISVWNRSLEPSEITALYNGGAGLEWSGPVDPVPSVTLHNPTVAQNFTDVSDIQFNCTATDDQQVVNVSLYINSTINITNSSPVNNSVQIWTVGLDNGQWNWTCGAFDNATVPQETLATERRFNVSDQRDIDTNLITPLDNAMITSAFQLFTYNATPSGVNATNTTFFLWFNNGSLFNSTFNNFADSNITIQTTTNITNLVEAGYIWNAESCADGGEGCTFATSNRTLEVHFTAPNITVNAPSGPLGAVVGGTTLQLNWSISESDVNLSAHIQNCSHTYNGVTTFHNTSVCVTVNTTTFAYSSGVDNITMNVTDIFNFTAFDIGTWIVTLSEINSSFNAITTEGATEDFDVFVSINPAFEIQSAQLTYNGTQSAGTLSTVSGQVRKAEISIPIPAVSANTNVSFFWTFLLNDSSSVNSLTQNQTIQDLSADDCTNGTTVLFNLTVVDEELQTKLNATAQNTSIELDFQLFSADRTVTVIDFSQNYTEVNPALICIAANLTDATIYSGDLQVRYEGGDYAAEFYNIQNGTIQNSTIPQVINLFDLNLDDSTEFLITFKGTDLLPVSDALVQITRKYISEGAFKTVEIPKTDSDGQAVAHLDLDSVIYTIILTTFGRVLATFDNVAVVCADESIGDCKINLNALASGETFDDFSQGGGITYDLSFDKPTRVLTLIYTSTDGSIKTVGLTTTRLDRFGNLTACTDSLTSAAGTLTCSIPASFSNATVIAELTSDSVVVTTASYSLSNQAADNFGVFGLILMLILVITLPLLFTGNKIAMLIGALIGIIAAGLLTISEGSSSLGPASALIWFVVGIGIVIWKLSRRNNGV